MSGMTSTIKNPTADNTKPLIGLDGELQTIAKAMESITWLQKSFGRAKSINAAQASLLPRLTLSQANEPMIYISDSEYYSTFPNDTLDSYSFWGVTAPQVGRDQINMPQSTMLFTTNVFCVVWGNLKKIDKTKDYIFTQELVKDVLNKLKRQPSFTLNQVIDERVEDIFRGYTLTPEKRDLLMYPFQAFRIEGVLNYSLKLC